MYSTINIRHKNISVLFKENSICIINNEQLSALITDMPETATDELVSAIKKEFRIQFNKEFDVADNSLAVEIWGHVFAEKFANAVKEIIPGKLTDSFAQKISLHCEEINIGKKDNDSNRIIWDWLAVFKPAIAAMLIKSD